MRSKDRIPAEPFTRWLNGEYARMERLYDAPAEKLGRRMGVSVKWLYRYVRQWDDRGNYVEEYDRTPVEEALWRYDQLELWQIPGYEDFMPADEDRGAETFCWSCRAFVRPLGVNVYDQFGVCPWCEEPIRIVDLSALPPREAEEVAREQAEAPALRVTHRPRIKMPPKPFYLDVLLAERRGALETFGRTRSIMAAARKLARTGHWSSPDSAALSFRTLLEREGWWEPPGRGGKAVREVAAAAAAKNVRRALREGTWDRVVEQKPVPSQRRVIDEALIHEALWLYFYDRLSFRRVAARLLPLTRARTSETLSRVLQDEWNRHGWPRRTERSSHARWYVPKGKARCRARTRGGRSCKRYARAGTLFCAGHTPELMDVRLANATRASRAAYADAVPLEPWRGWLRRRVQALGSVKAVHRRAPVVSYDTLTVWVALEGRPRGGKPKVLTVRRSTIDRFLEAWGDGTTFEDIYMPVEDDQVAA